MDLNSINTYLVPVVFGAVGWFVQAFWKLQTEFYEHRASKGHKELIDSVSQETTEIKASIVETQKSLTALITQEVAEVKTLVAEIQTATKVNASRIENIHEALRDLAKGSKYRFETSDNRLSLMEEVMRREGYTIFKKQKTTTEINKDTLDLDDDDES